MGINTPIVNAGLKYINGLALTNDATTPDEIVNIAAGQIRNSTNLNDIVLSAAVDVNITLSGAGGLDNGAVAASTFYAVHLIGDSTGYNDAAGLFSTSATAPVLPAGYDMFARIGYVLTDGTSDILAFWQYGNGTDRWMMYDVGISELSGGSATSFTAVDAASSVPAMATLVRLDIAYTPNAATNKAEFRPTGSAATAGSVRYGCGVAAAQVGEIVVQCDAAASFDYKVAASDALTLLVTGYVDNLLV